MPKRKPIESAVALAHDGTLSTEGGSRTALPDELTPEHLLLAALASCSLASLAYHGRRASLAVTASARASGTVFEREDGSWGFVELECRIDARLDPVPNDDVLPDLLARGERGCFVGASLVPKPAYRWRVNGADLT